MKKFLNKPLPPTYIDVEGAQAYVMSDSKDVLIACRGTEPTELNDVKADLKTWPVDHHKGGKVHRGFYAEYKKVIPGIKEALAKHNKKGVKDVWVCGHSLGGAMALLVSVELEPSGGCHTFGQPRVGNAQFLKSVNFPYYRYRNNNDIVTKVPLWIMGYRHHGNLHYITSDCKIGKPGFKDWCKGMWAGIKARRFDSIGDHDIQAYYDNIDKALDE